MLARHLEAARASRAAGDLGAAARSFDAALRLWQAAPLSGVPGPWAEIERVRLSEVRLTAIEERAEVMLMLGRAAAMAAELTGLAGTLYRYLETGGHYPDAITIHSAARRAARRTGDRAAEATALTNLGIVDWRQGRYRQAAGHHRRALKVSRQIGNRSGEATALNNLGIIYERQGRYQQAADHYRQTAILSAELDDRVGEARALANLGGIDCLQKRYEQTAGHLHRALVLFREIGDRQGEAAALAGLGLVDGRQGRYDRAAEHYRLAVFTVLGAPETDDVELALTALAWR